MKRSIITAALALIVAILLLPLLAMAQPAPAITPDTACGAPGVGRVYAGARAGQIEARDGAPGVRVNERGNWARCTMPPAPRDCPARPAPGWTGKGGHYCQPVPGRMIPARNAPFGHDVGSAKTSRNAGIAHWRCEKWPDGATEWRPVRSTCSPRR